jgi:hypothetical protein
MDADPAPVARGPLTVGTHLRQHRVDEPDEVMVPKGHRQAVRLARQRRADDLGFRVLRCKSGQDRVVG